MPELAENFGWGQFSEPSRLLLGGTYETMDRSSPILKVLVRDNFTCAVCGFKSRPSERVLSGYMQICLADPERSRARDLEDYVCVCPFCNAYNDVPFALSSGRFKLGYSPMANRAVFNNFFRALLVLSDSDSTIKRSEAISLFDTLASTESHVLSKIPIISNLTGKSPTERIKLFFELLQAQKSEELIEKTVLFSDGLYLIPVRKSWKEQWKYWEKSSYEGLLDDFSKLRRKIGIS